MSHPLDVRLRNGLIAVAPWLSVGGLIFLLIGAGSEKAYGAGAIGLGLVLLVAAWRLAPFADQDGRGPVRFVAVCFGLPLLAAGLGWLAVADRPGNAWGLGWLALGVGALTFWFRPGRAR